MDRGAYSPWGHKDSDMTEYAHTCTIIYIHIFTEVMYVLFVFYHIVAQQSKNLPVMQATWV